MANPLGGKIKDGDPSQDGPLFSMWYNNIPQAVAWKNDSLKVVQWTLG